MGKSILSDLVRDNNIRYFNSFYYRTRKIGFIKLVFELYNYCKKYNHYPTIISTQKPNFKYKLFVFYNYFKIIYVHPNINFTNLIEYFPTRMQQFFIYDLDPKEMREITYNKILFYLELKKESLPFPTTYLYLKENQSYSLDGQIINISQINFPDMLFAKPISENGGVNAKIISKEEIVTLSDGMLVQEIAKNHIEIAELSGNHAFNTIRIITYLDSKKNVHILIAIYRLSTGKQVDNWGQGSINVEVDIETGRLGKFGLTKYNQVFYKHPSSEILFEGFQLPYWEDFLSITRKSALKFQYLRFIAWDIGIADNGPLIVEANSGCDFFHAQLFKPLNNSVLIKDLIKYKGNSLNRILYSHR